MSFDTQMVSLDSFLFGLRLKPRSDCCCQVVFPGGDTHWEVLISPSFNFPPPPAPKSNGNGSAIGIAVVSLSQWWLSWSLWLLSYGVLGNLEAGKKKEDNLVSV